jgi:hypothetical protein
MLRPRIQYAPEPVASIPGAAVVIDVNNKRVNEAIEVDGRHFKPAFIMVLVIPLAGFTCPEEYPCHIAGGRTVEAISQLPTTQKTPRIAVMAAKTNPYVIYQRPGQLRCRDYDHCTAITCQRSM